MRKLFAHLMAVLFVSCGFVFGQGLNDGLVAYYPFNGNANDESGNGNDGVVVGPFSFLNEKDYFTPNGNSRIEAPHLPSTNSYPITISARIRSSNPETYAPIVSQYSNASWNGYALIGSESSFNGFFARNTFNGIYDDYGNDFKTNEIEADKWYSVVFTVAEDGGRLFVDGQLADTQSWSREPVNATSTYPLTIGFRQGSNVYGSGVDIDDVRIYERALSAQEVANLHAIESAQLRLEVIEGNFTWQEAKADAEAKGGRLAVLDTQEKIDAANSFLSSVGSWPSLWLGLSNEVTEGDWRWITGEAITAHNWKSGEPNGGIGDNYYGHIFASSIGSTWNDTVAHDVMAYLLEILDRPPAAPFVEL